MWRTLSKQEKKDDLDLINHVYSRFKRKLQLEQLIIEGSGSKNKQKEAYDFFIEAREEPFHDAAQALDPKTNDETRQYLAEKAKKKNVGTNPEFMYNGFKKVGGLKDPRLEEWRQLALFEFEGYFKKFEALEDKYGLQTVMINGAPWPRDYFKDFRYNNELKDAAFSQMIGAIGRAYQDDKYAVYETPENRLNSSGLLERSPASRLETRQATAQGASSARLQSATPEQYHNHR